MLPVHIMAAPYEMILNGERGCYVLVFRNWVSKEKADRLYTLAKEECTTYYPINMAGKIITQPRTNCAFSDKHITSHKYNSAEGIATAPWPPEVEEIRDEIYRQWKIYVDSSLVNGYADGNEYIGYHSDKELKDNNRTVVTVSTGASRPFYYQWIDTGVVVKTILHHGDCLVMYGNTNILTKHSIPKIASVKTSRYSFTFRVLSESTLKVLQALLGAYPNLTIEDLKKSITAVLG